MKPQHFPITATIAALIAFFALYLAPGGFWMAPVLALAVLASYGVEARLDNKSWLTQGIAIALCAIIIIPSISSFTGDNGDPPELVLAHVVGEVGGCLLALQYWLRRPIGGAGGSAAVLLSGLVMMGASNTFDTGYIRYLAPAYMLFLALSLREFRAPLPAASSFTIAPAISYETAGRARAWGWLALFAAIMSGALLHFGVLLYRNQINDIGMKLIGDHQPTETSGISTTPTLGASYGASGALTRMLRIEGFRGQPYLRVMAFDHYAHGAWEPSVSMRHYATLTPRQMRGDAPGHHMRINRLVDDNNFIFAPLDSAGFVAPTSLEWAVENGGPLRSIDPAPYPFIYDVIVNGDADYQGPLCAPPSAEQRARCLEVSPEIAPAVRVLAQSLGAGAQSPVERAEAVQQYLMTHNAYSLTMQPGPGDPTSNFLLQHKAAHCEYFASAATILLRCLGVPTRYVIGYYVHEADGPGAALVRGRDAHAWAESWIDSVGWITVDATPGGGRPDQTADPLPFWVKLREQLQDRLVTLRATLHNLSRTQQAMILSGLALILIFRGWQRRERKRQAPTNPTFVYTTDAELAIFAARFEQVLQRQGLTCPPHRTWHEHFAQWEQASDGQPPPAVQSASAFLRTYNLARFGQPANRVTKVSLEALLDAVEQAPATPPPVARTHTGKEKL